MYIRASTRCNFMFLCTTVKCELNNLRNSVILCEIISLYISLKKVGLLLITLMFTSYLESILHFRVKGTRRKVLNTKTYQGQKSFESFFFFYYYILLTPPKSSCACRSDQPEHGASTSGQSRRFQPEVSFSFTVGRKQWDTQEHLKWEENHRHMMNHETK